MPDKINKSSIKHFLRYIQLGLIRILIAMGIGFIVASVLNPAGTSRLIGRILYNPSSLSEELKLDEIYILLGFGIGLIILGVLLYTFMNLIEYRSRLVLLKLKKNQTKKVYTKGHNQLLELQFIVTISFLVTFIASRAFVISFGESRPSLSLWIGDYHVHHFFYGIILLSISGWISLVENRTKYKRISALLYGSGLGLLIDEIGLLITWGNYWAKQSYIFSVIVIFIFLSIIIYEHMQDRKR